MFHSFATTHPDAKVRHHTSDMILHILNDASYLSVKQAKRWVGGYFCLSSMEESKDINGTLFITCNILKNVVASAAEAKMAALFHNAQEGLFCGQHWRRWTTNNHRPQLKQKIQQQQVL